MAEMAVRHGVQAMPILHGPCPAGHGGTPVGWATIPQPDGSERPLWSRSILAKTPVAPITGFG
ncbi:hypothetical protein [Devosia sp. A449]